MLAQFLGGHTAVSENKAFSNTQRSWRFMWCSHLSIYTNESRGGPLKTNRPNRSLFAPISIPADVLIAPGWSKLITVLQQSHGTCGALFGR